MLALRIALRYLFARKSHTAVNIISLISMAGIALAAMAMVCVLSVFNGFHDLASSRLSGVDPDIRVSMKEGGLLIENADSVARLLAGVAGVERALPMLERQALLINDDVQTPVEVRGVGEGYDHISGIGESVIDGERLEPDESYFGRKGAMLSVGAAIASGARPSLEKTVRLTVPRRLGRINPAFPLSAFVTDTLVVTGVYQTYQAEHDAEIVYISLTDARRLYDYTTQGTSVDIALKAGASTPAAVKAISELLGDDYLVADRLRQQEASFRMIEIEKWITFLMLVFVLVMASFNILSTMAMLIIEKRGNMHILNAMGATPAMIRNIFRTEGFLISAIGGCAGIAVGVVLCLLQEHFGLIELGGDHTQMSVTSYPCRVAMSDLLITAGIVIVTGIVSGLIAAGGVELDKEK